MSYKRRVNNKLAEEITKKLATEVPVLERTKLISGAHIAVLKDILVDAGLTTEEEFRDRTIDASYEIMKKSGLI